jgi:hypothetical protein
MLKTKNLSKMIWNWENSKTFIKAHATNGKRDKVSPFKTCLTKQKKKIRIFLIWKFKKKYRKKYLKTIKSTFKKIITYKIIKNIFYCREYLNI